MAWLAGIAALKILIKKNLSFLPFIVIPWPALRFFLLRQAWICAIIAI